MDRFTPTASSMRAWVVYDLANTIFALGVIGLYFPAWMAENDIADSRLALVEALAGVTVIFAAPWIGARTDHSGRRLPSLAWTTGIAVAMTLVLDLGSQALTFLALAIALIGFNTGSVVYDALLPDVSTDETRGWISGLGVGVGYLGSFIGLGLGVLTLDILEWGYAATFRVLGVGFLIFAIPTFLLVRERPRSPRPGPPPSARSLVTEVAEAWRRAARYPDAFQFLIGRFLYTDAINTLIGGFLTIFVIEELGMSVAESRNLLGGAILAAMLGGLGGGRLAQRHGPLRTLRWMLVGWMVAIGFGVGAALTGSLALAWMIAPLGGFALGGTWAADRVVMLRVSPPRHLGEFYGLYAMVGRFATILGPLIWAITVDLLHLGRPVAMAALGVFVLAGWLRLARVDDRPRAWSADES
ncbi:MAG: MFS transporter [Acidimicrobiia bacterium]|nr:MFS transporter [Acidimicrobiia bacterium]